VTEILEWGSAKRSEQAAKGKEQWAERYAPMRKTGGQLSAVTAIDDRWSLVSGHQ
jgi:hypothetical protein